MAWPLVARAAGAPAVPPTVAPGQVYHLATGVSLAFIVPAVVVVAFLINRFAPKKRRHVRDTAVAALLYVFSFGASWVLELAGAAAAATVARELAEFFGLVTAINLGVLVFFDLGLSALHVSFAPFVASLMVGLGDVAAVVITLRHLGVELSSILATSALLTTITAFSLQGTLANVVGGVALQIDDSIRVGDWVQLENGKQGKVREIRWRYTVIETRDWDTIIVPNATVLSSNVIILGKREGQPIQHRMWVYFNVDFRYSPVDVIEAVNTGLQAAPIECVALEPKPHAICYDFAKDGRDSFAYYAVRYWLTDLARDDPTSSRVRERIFTALKRAGIPLAMPAAHVWVEQDSENRARRQKAEDERRRAALDAVEFLRSLTEEERRVLRRAAQVRALRAGRDGHQAGRGGALALHHRLRRGRGAGEHRGDRQGGGQDPGARLRRRDGPDDGRAAHGHGRRADRGGVLPARQGGVQQDHGRPARRSRRRSPSVLASRKVELLAVREDLDVDSKRLRARGGAPAAGEHDPALLRPGRRAAELRTGEVDGLARRSRPRAPGRRRAGGGGRPSSCGGW